ncbi:MAG: response regulator [bacterium]|nr:response regulator [bacterium]
MKIMIIDESEMVRHYYYYILKTAGFDIISAIDGSDGLEKLLTFPEIALVVTGINMPRLDGYTMIEKIREEEQFKDLPIIIVSTHNNITDKQKGLDAGANLYLTKPIDPDTLLDAVRTLV